MRIIHAVGGKDLEFEGYVRESVEKRARYLTQVRIVRPPQNLDTLVSIVDSGLNYTLRI